MTGTARWFLSRFVRPLWPLLAVAFLMMAVEGGMQGLLSYMIKPMFDRVLVGGDRGALLWVAAVVFLIFVIRGATGFLHRALISRVGQRISVAMQGGLVAHLLRLDSKFFTETPPGTLIERVRGDTLAAAAVPATVLAPIGREGAAFLSLLGVAISIDWVWTATVLAGAPLLTLPAVTIQKRVRRAAVSARAAAARLSTRLDEIFHGITPIKFAGTERREADRYASELRLFARYQVRAETQQASIPALMDIVAGLGFAGLLVLGGSQIGQGGKTVGDFMAFFTAIALMFEPLRRLGGVSGAWAAAEASIARLRQLYAEQPTILSPASPQVLPVPAGQADIRFEAVQFGYGEAPVLRGLSLTAKAGQTTALVGASGAGKSTVFTLLARLAEPQAGRITIGGVDVARMALADLRGLFSVVAQETILFDETLRDNILMGAEVPEAELLDAVRAAHVAEFAASLPGGLDSPAGPRGSALSGGQRQRVAIARALLRDRPILLLDEATSALDAASEAAVQAALAELSAGRTTLVIAHRLSTIISADRIVVMDRGQVVDEGTHEELLARGGIYAGLYNMQVGGAAQG